VTASNGRPRRGSPYGRIYCPSCAKPWSRPRRKRGPQRLSLIELLSQEQWNPDWAVMHYRGAKGNNVKISLVGLYFLTRKTYRAAFSRSSVNPVLPATGVSKLLTHSGERVRQIESKALSALRRQTRSNLLRDFADADCETKEVPG
jgi:hypothetical protein